MAEEKEEYSFIEEEIVEKKKYNKKFYNSLKKTAIRGVVFGIVGGFVFALSNFFFSDLFREQNRSKISFGGSQKEQVNNTAVPTQKVEKEPTLKPASANPGIIAKEKSPMVNYKKVYDLLGSKAEKVNRSIVSVSKKGVDILDNPLENQEFSFGVIVANNDDELLILTSRNKIKGNDAKVTFQDGRTVNATLYGSDTNTHITILAVPIQKIASDTLESIEIAELGESDTLKLGSPIMLLGSPNGYMYSMEMGYVSSLSHEKSVMDYNVELFYTNTNYYENGEGIVVDLEGDVVGICNHNSENNKKEVIQSFFGITRLKPIIENLVNKKAQTYVGVTIQDLTADFSKKHNIEKGVYIGEIISNSPAYEAGLQVGDVVIDVNGTEIDSVVSFYQKISEYKVKDTVSVKVIRTTQEDKEKVFNVVLQKRK